MARLLKNGSIFIHIPKCGGEWVNAALRAQGLRAGSVGRKHARPDEVEDIFAHHPWHYVKRWWRHPWASPGLLRSALKFTFVRSPIGWYESYWKFTAGRWPTWGGRYWHPQDLIAGCEDDDFNGFVTKVLDRRPGYVSEMYSWYTPGCDFVGRCERLADDLVEVLRRLGREFDEAALRGTPRVNVSPSLKGAPRWDPEVLRRVVEAEQGAIREFGYGEDVAGLLGEVAAS